MFENDLRKNWNDLWSILELSSTNISIKQKVAFVRKTLLKVFVNPTYKCDLSSKWFGKKNQWKTCHLFSKFVQGFLKETTQLSQEFTFLISRVNQNHMLPTTCFLLGFLKPNCIFLKFASSEISKKVHLEYNRLTFWSPFFESVIEKMILKSTKIISLLKPW